MNLRRIYPLMAVLGLGILAGPAPGPEARAGSVTFMVTADTSSVTGTAGQLEFQFIASPGAAVANAVVSNFASDGTLGTIPAPFPIGNITGSLTPPPPNAALVFVNDQVDDYVQNFTYGSMTSFDVTLYGPAVAPPAPPLGTSGGTTFSFFLEDSNGNGLASGGSSLDININFDGSVTYSNNSLPNGGPPVTIVQVTGAVPEPSSVVLLALGLVAMAGLGRHRGRRDHGAA